MAAGGAGETSAGNLRRAKYSDVCNWVKRSWEGISDEIIINSFVSCSITDSLDNLDDEHEELDIFNIDDDIYNDNINNNNSD
jgi:hypothetical protein